MVEPKTGYAIQYPLDTVPDTEFSQKFVQGMANRTVVSYFKYGAVPDAVGKVDFIASLYKRLGMYAETGNTEWLMDVGNFAMFEFMHPGHPQAHFKATDADESPGRLTVNGETTAIPNKEL